MVEAILRHKTLKHAEKNGILEYPSYPNPLKKSCAGISFLKSWAYPNHPNIGI
jgi:hypothetical protein